MTRRISPPKITIEEDLRQQLYVLLERSTGGDPSQLLTLLEQIVENRSWERLGQTFIAFLTTPYEHGGVGWSLENLKAVLSMHHRFEHLDPDIAARMATLRRTISELMTLPAQSHGGKRSRDLKDRQPDNVRLQNYGNSRDSTVARLKRDRPDLAQRVLDGEMSANQAAIEAGFRRYRLSIDPNDVEKTAETLRRYLSAEQLALLSTLLRKAI